MTELRDMSRVVILVADSLGVGYAPDAKDFGDEGANTFASIAKHMNKIGEPLNIPNLTSLGLVAACEEASNESLELPKQAMTGSYGYMKELSSGKDTPSGHWEMAGVPVLFDWGYFTEKENSFPQEFLNELMKRTGIKGTLANRHASGTDVLKWFGDEHCATKMPICYTSADSVFQIAAHEEHFGLERLYEVCEVARELLDDYNIGRVIARPFVGDNPENYARTGNRRDFSVLPPSPTVLDRMVEKGGKVISVGKISDIYAHQGVSEAHKATGLEQLIDKTIDLIKQDTDKEIIFTNLVNFDQDYGHRRDIVGYGKALEYFDTRLPDIMSELSDDDLLLITADHGCDPSWPGSDHTREYVPILAYQKGKASKQLGERETFADMGQTIAELFDLAKLEYGKSFLSELN